ncbi:MAG: alpha/beta fold hydrolase [Gammaproteobacteria bacterium]|nr:alpha/beta fold hydrolase [Gammaproteobacteria bacterium]
MKKKVPYSFAAASLVTIGLTAPAFAGGEAGTLELRDAGARFVGYTSEPKQDGSRDVRNAMFVQYLLPAERRHRYPVVMIHGGGGQGTDWLETPDGRDSWADYFVADGWDVYVVDRPGHGRSQSNASCGDGAVGTANSAIISRLATADADVWPGGEPTPANDAVIGWTASGTTAPYCGDALAAQTISALLDEIGPAILLAHSAGGGSTFRVPELNADNVVGIIAFEAAGANPTAPGFGGSPALITNLTGEPALPGDFAAADRDGCMMQGDDPSRLVHYADLPIVLVAAERGLASHDDLMCQEAVWDQAGADASYVWLPDRGLQGGGHFAMAQLDTAEYARVFIDIAESVEAAAAE